jgi:hypothetical protein
MLACAFLAVAARASRPGPRQRERAGRPR